MTTEWTSSKNSETKQRPVCQTTSRSNYTEQTGTHFTTKDFPDPVQEIITRMPRPPLDPARPSNKSQKNPKKTKKKQSEKTEKKTKQK